MRQPFRPSQGRAATEEKRVGSVLFYLPQSFITVAVRTISFFAVSHNVFDFSKRVLPSRGLTLPLQFIVGLHFYKIATHEQKTSKRYTYDGGGHREINKTLTHKQ